MSKTASIVEVAHLYAVSPANFRGKQDWDFKVGGQKEEPAYFACHTALDVMAVLGAEGWEPCFPMPTGEGPGYIFKRTLQTVQRDVQRNL